MTGPLAKTRIRLRVTDIMIAVAFVALNAMSWRYVSPNDPSAGIVAFFTASLSCAGMLALTRRWSYRATSFLVAMLGQFALTLFLRIG